MNSTENMMIQSQDNVTQSQDNVTQSQDNVTQSQDNVTQSQDNATQSQDNVTQSQDNVKPNPTAEEARKLFEDFCVTHVNTCNQLMAKIKELELRNKVLEKKAKERWEEGKNFAEQIMKMVLNDKIGSVIDTDEYCDAEAKDWLMFRIHQEMRKGRAVFGEVGECPICCEERQLLNNFSIEPDVLIPTDEDDSEDEKFDMLHIGTRGNECICMDCYCKLKLEESKCPYTRKGLGICINETSGPDTRTQYFDERSPMEKFEIKLRNTFQPMFAERVIEINDSADQ